MLKLNSDIASLTDEQRMIFNTVKNDIKRNNKRVYFVDGPGETGKSFLFNTILALVRSESKIAIAVASSGIAALLLTGERTAYSRFKIPMKVDENTISIQDILRSIELLGNVILIFGGDMRQILPVLYRAERTEIVSVTLNRSNIWRNEV